MQKQNFCCIISRHMAWVGWSLNKRTVQNDILIGISTSAYFPEYQVIHKKTEDASVRGL